MAEPKKLLILASACPAIGQIRDAVQEGQRRGWTVHVAFTPNAVELANTYPEHVGGSDLVETLEAMTAFPVYSEYSYSDARQKTRPIRAKDYDAIVFAPLTVNSMSMLLSGTRPTLPIALAQRGSAERRQARSKGPNWVLQPMPASLGSLSS